MVEFGLRNEQGKEQTYQKGGNGGESKSLVAAKVGVTKESTKQGREVGGAIEDSDQRRRSDGAHVEDSSQVNQEVWQGTNGS